MKSQNKPGEKLTSGQTGITPRPPLLFERYIRIPITLDVNVNEQCEFSGQGNYLRCRTRLQISATSCE